MTCDESETDLCEGSLARVWFERSVPFGEAPNMSGGVSMSRGSLACAFSACVVVLVLRRLVS